MMRMTPFDEMDRLFDQMRRSMLEGRRVAGFDDVNLQLEREEDSYVVRADLPGYDRDEIDLQFDEGTLSIDAVHESSEDDEVRTRRVHEELRIPGAILVEDATAEYHNGVLEVRLPTDVETEDGHRIDVR